MDDLGDDSSDDLVWSGQQFEAHSGQLRAVAYRMLGSLSDADDAVQEAWLRLARSGADGVDNLGAWLTTVVGRICLDMLRTRQSRREDPWDTRMPDPIVDIVGGSDPQQQALLADSVGLALLVMLDTLSPAERLVFVLHDMFAVPFREIGPMVGRSPGAAKQLASRARRRVRGGTPDLDPDPARQREVVDAFLAASRGGSLGELLAVLDPDVVLRADYGAPGSATGTGRGGMKVARGARLVAEQALLFSQFARYAQPALVNGAWGLVTVREGQPVSVMGLTIRAGRIVELNILADPARLRGLELGGPHEGGRD